LNKEKPLAPTAIVMFKSLVATNIALQVISFTFSFKFKFKTKFF